MSHIKQDRCNTPRIGRSRRGSLWLCTCGQLWTAQYTNWLFDEGGWGWFKVNGEALKIEGMEP